jgi:hypothetical protein
MARLIKRVAAKRDLTDHFVFLAENASMEVGRAVFLHACTTPVHLVHLLVTRRSSLLMLLYSLA